MTTELSAESLGVFTEASKLLAYAVQAASDLSIEIPHRQYVTAGQAVYDCEQVAATLISTQTGMPGAVVPGGAAISACPGPWQVIVEIAIVRCQTAKVSAKGSPPATDQLLDDAQTLAGDTHIIQTAVLSRVSESFGSVTCTVTYPPPNGGMMAAVARVAMTVST